MKKNRWFLRMMALLLISAVLNVTVMAVGTDQDPLVTLSYLNDTFMDAMMERVDQKISQRNEQLAQRLSGREILGGGGTAVTFTVVSLANGQTLTGGAGCEVMLRLGSAVCVSPSSPGLIDETTAATLNDGGALAQNHLYMMTIEGRGVRATADTVKLLVRGAYSIA